MHSEPNQKILVWNRTKRRQKVKAFDQPTAAENDAGSPKEIPLTCGKIAIVDPEDFEYLSQFNWYFSCGYALRNIPRRRVDPCKQMKMHREIISAPEGVGVDHINGNPLDNRRCNLRFASKAENGRNRGKNRNNKSGFKGVCWTDRSGGRWVAQITVDRKCYNLGYFLTSEEAHEAYKAAAIEFHGEFAKF